jgi:hypothetical protein
MTSRPLVRLSRLGSAVAVVGGTVVVVVGTVVGVVGGAGLGTTRTGGVVAVLFHRQRDVPG